MQTALLLLPDFALIALGAWLRRAFHLGDHFWTGLEKLVYFILFPALLFNAITRQSFSLSDAAPLVGSGVAIMLAGAALLHLTGVEADTALIFAPRPVASSAYILAQRMGGDGVAVAWVISTSTVPRLTYAR